MNDVHQRLFGPCFEGQILSKYGSYDVLVNAYKYINYDLTNVVGHMIIIFIMGFISINMFFAHFIMGFFLLILNLNVIMKNIYEKGNCGYVLRVGFNTFVEHIDPILIFLKFVAINIIQDFRKRGNLQELSYIDTIVTSYYKKFNKSFILLILTVWILKISLNLLP